MKQTTYLPSKPRYEILDGLRGVASLIVVAFHLFETYSHGPREQILNHGYLAVDFFFVLSGFVIGYAYDDRWDRMTTWDFFKRRLVRLHPMVIMGTLIGVVFFYFGSSDGFPLIDETAWWKVLVVMLFACLMIPVGKSLDIRGWSETNPLNGPNWSLSWEYVANILYALIIRRFSKLLLGIFVACSALLTIDLCLNIDVFGLLEPRSYAAYTPIGGWSLTPDQLYIGITRLLYPFFVGLLLSRLTAPLNPPKGGTPEDRNKKSEVIVPPFGGIEGGCAFYLCSLLVAIFLVMPYVGTAEQPWIDGAYNAVCILVFFPLIVAMGAGSTVKGRRSIALCKFCGEISYPLYITHYPLIYMQMSWAAHHPDAPLSQHVFVSVCIFFLAIAVAYACLKLYDEPVREWLKQHVLMKKK